VYSQNDEEKWILEAVGNTPGNFLDIGAYDGKTFSNTYRLVELGWSGICVEPAPTVFPALFNLHKSNEKVKCINAAVVPSGPSKLMAFFDSNGDALGTLSCDHVAKWSPYAKFSPCWVYPISMVDLINQIPEDFDFVNIDVEGISTNLFESFVRNYKGNRLKCVCVEHDGHVSEVIETCSKIGLAHYYVTSENVISWRIEGENVIPWH
jgi:FkbM family methyltransferase